MTVTASRKPAVVPTPVATKPQAPANAKPAPGTVAMKPATTPTKVAAVPNKPAPAAPAPAKSAAASFSERMAKTTVTPPVVSSGAKATNVAPAKAAPANPAGAAPAKLATAPARPNSPAPGAKPGWFFRQVVATSSSTANMKG